MRIAVGGIRHESNNFSSLVTSLEEFTIARGDDILLGEQFIGHGDDVTFVPTLSAHAPPHGLVGTDAYRAMRDELRDRLRAGLPLDALYLDLHGAMDVVAIGDGESDLIRHIRAAVGPNLPIALSLDLHANLAPEVIAAADIATAYRTAPHRDGVATRRRAIDLLVTQLRAGRRHHTAMVKPPCLIPGEYAVTDVEPARSLYANLDTFDRRPGIVDTSIVIGCAWTDSEYTSTAALAVGERAAGEATAREIAAGIWAARERFAPEVPTLAIGPAIARARAATDTPVFLSDSGDNVTAGAAGDLTIVLRALIAAGARDTLVVGICNPDAVAACRATGSGARISLSLGGRLDTRNGTPFDTTATVGGLREDGAVLTIDGVTVVITTARDGFITLDRFAHFGLDPRAYRIVVVKTGYLFPEMRTIARDAILLLSPGFTDLDLARLPYRRVRRPIFPLDRLLAWAP